MRGGAAVLLAAAIAVAVSRTDGQLHGSRARRGRTGFGRSHRSRHERHRRSDSRRRGPDGNRVRPQPACGWSARRTTPSPESTQTRKPCFEPFQPTIRRSTLSSAKKAVWLLISSKTAFGGGPARLGRVDPGLYSLQQIPIGTGPFGFGAGPVQSLAASRRRNLGGQPISARGVSRMHETTQKVSAPFTVTGPTLASTPGPQAVSRAHPESRPGREHSGWEAMQGWYGSRRISAASSATIPLDRRRFRRQSRLGKAQSGWSRRPGFRCCPAETVGTGTLTRIDPTTNYVVETIPIGGTRRRWPWRRIGLGRRSRDALGHRASIPRQTSGQADQGWSAARAASQSAPALVWVSVG